MTNIFNVHIYNVKAMEARLREENAETELMHQVPLSLLSSQPSGKDFFINHMLNFVFLCDSIAASRYRDPRRQAAAIG